MSCLGLLPRESGQSRVPDPPAMITPYCIGSLYYSRQRRPRPLTGSDPLLHRQIGVDASNPSGTIFSAMLYNARMALTCNIDAKGKAVRLVYGIIMLMIGLAVTYWWAWGSHSVLWWIIAVSCLIAGAIGIFEARAGWCVVRAMGFKTRM
jgi:hypothetical protein